MLHQFIFAAPRPGMSEAEFQDYWVHRHAVDFASKIPGIRRYAVDTRIARPDETGAPLFSGCAEIWLDDVDALLAALQSPELIRGARADEPNWAAFWQTIALNTDTEVLLPGPPVRRADGLVKLMVLLKRLPGTTMDAFRRHARDVHAPKVLAMPGLRRLHVCPVPDMFYAVSETPFDGVAMLWFDDVAAMDAALASPAYVDGVLPDAATFLDTRYMHTLAMTEHWIIGPDATEVTP